MLTAAAYDIHMEQLLERMRRFHAALSGAGIPYRVVGGMGVFIHVFERNPEQARLTADVVESRKLRRRVVSVSGTSAA